MKLKEIIRILTENNVPFVLIGGVALNAHGSNRVTLDSDIAVKTIDIDMIIDLLLSAGLKMVVGVDKEQYPELTDDPGSAKVFAEKSNWGFLKFLNEDIELDVLYEIPIPFIRLLNDSIIKKIEGIGVPVASLEHIRIMKEKAMEYRDDEKRDNDLLDLRFIEKKLGEK